MKIDQNKSILEKWNMIETNFGISNSRININKSTHEDLETLSEENRNLKNEISDLQNNQRLNENKISELQDRKKIINFKEKVIKSKNLKL